MAISVSNLSFSINAGSQDNIRTRTQSSVYSKNVKSDIISRPKSSPIKFNPDGLDTFYLTPRTQTAPTYVHNISGYNHTCKRSEKVDSGAVRQYKFPIANDRRVISTPQTSLKHTEPQKVYNLGPGYVIYRNDSEFTIRIDSNEFFGPKKKTERESATKKYVQDHKDILISQLQEQIVSISVALEEEKMNHVLSNTNWQKELESTRTILIDNNEENMKDLREDHLKLVENINREHLLMMVQQKEELNQKINCGFLELNTYKASFESFRQALMRETEEKNEKQKNSVKQDFEEILRTKLEKQKSFMTANFEIDMERIKQEHFSEIQEIAAKQKSEIETLNRRFAEVSALEDKLSRTLQDLARKKKDMEKSQAEYDKLYEMYSGLRKEMTITRNDSENLKSELQDFTDRFEERVRRVDDDYREKMDSLHNQIVEIRRAYMAKCEELVQERNKNETQLHGRIETAKDVMKELIHTRQRARISLVSIDTDAELEDLIGSRRRSDDLIRSPDQQFLGVSVSQLACNYSGDTVVCRPSSAPTTNLDEKLAKHNIYLINKDLL